ncbi:SGNH/GDSL hydrolase family protein [Gordonia caeni]|uniref:SGNH/GDSL hydrolase family protein n=1 Tax=Gordonia caeni TaxID=1007097 RepID=UPI0031DC4D75
MSILLCALTLALSFGWAAPAAAMPDPGPRGAEYVSLGDSFVASGSMSTATGEACGQATDNVGRLVAQRMRGVSFADWACGGADTADFTEVTDKGPQIRGLSEKTKYVSISIGGNDENLFGGVVQDCLVGALCTEQHTRAALDKLDRLGPKLDRVYAAVRESAPNAKVVVLGYLRLLPDTPAGCFADVVTGPSVVRFANRLQAGLNGTIAEAAERAGFTMVNQEPPAGRSMCAPDGRRYVSLTGVGPRDAGVPIHPTLAGRKYTARLIADALAA